MTTEVKIGASVGTLIDETNILEGIVAFLGERFENTTSYSWWAEVLTVLRLRLDTAYLEHLRNAHSSFMGRTGRISGEGPVMLMRNYMVEFSTAEIRLREDALESMKARIGLAQIHKHSKPSHSQLQACIKRYKEAELVYEAAEVKIQDEFGEIQTFSTGYSPSRTDFRLPSQDLEYRRALVNLNQCREELGQLSQPSGHSGLEDHQDFTELVKNAVLACARSTNGLNTSLVVEAGALEHSTRLIEPSISIGRISDLRDREKRRPEFEAVKYLNPLTGVTLDSPMWGIPDIIVTDREGNKTDLRLGIAEYYVKRIQASPYLVSISRLKRLQADISADNHNSTEPTFSFDGQKELNPQRKTVLDLAFDSENNFSLAILRNRLDSLKVADVKGFLEFVLINQPNPMFEIGDEDFLRVKNGWRTRFDISLWQNYPSMATVMSNQQPANKSLLRLLCDTCLWDAELSEAVTHRTGSNAMLVDIARKWNFDGDRLKRTR